MTDKYAVIDDFDLREEGYPVTKMCDWLEVSRSGFYEWRGRPASATARRRQFLGRLVVAAFKEGRGVSGYRRVQAQLARWGYPVSLGLVRRLMRENGLVAGQPRAYRTTTKADAAAAATPDLVDRDFTASGPGEKLVGDITYLRTWQGWVYLATVIDCFDRRVVGWAMADHMRAELVGDAFTMAATNVTFSVAAVFHSDRGAQYTSAEYRHVLARHGVTPSVGRTGVCWDNALAESFFGALKNELVHRTVFPTRRHARRAVAEYIEVFYNRVRLHSALGYRTPFEVYKEYQAGQAAA